MAAKLDLFCYRRVLVSRHGRFAVLVFACVALWSCAPSIDVPPPPDVQPFLEGFASPTADVGASVMSAADAEIGQLEADIQGSTLLQEFLELVQGIREAVAENTDEDGNLVIDGTSYESPNGLITINRVCRGHDPTSDVVDPEINGTIQLFMPLTDGMVGPEVWGTATACLYEVGGENLSYDGDVTLHFGGLIDEVVDLRNETITFVIDGVLGFGNREIALLQSFRITAEERLEILLQVADVGTFVYFFEVDRLAQGIRDATGTFDCLLEDRTCDKDPGGFSW